MSAIDCRAEMIAHCLTVPTHRRLKALGVDGGFAALLGSQWGVGQARVLLQSRGRFWEPVGPDARLLLAIYEGDQMVDIAAVSAAYPSEVALRTGYGWCLGSEQIEAAHRAVLAERRAVLRIVADPLEWLRWGGQALCVFDWAVAVRELRLLGERVTVECDAGAGEQLRAILKVGGLPRVRERAPVPVRRQEAA